MGAKGSKSKEEIFNIILNNYCKTINNYYICEKYKNYGTYRM